MKKKLWFKAKNYGWGWYPVSIEGWIVTLAFVLYIFLISFLMLISPILYYFLFAVGIFALIAICYKTGEKPEWRWGKPKDKKK